MRSLGALAAMTLLVVTLGACTTIERAVRGFEAGPGGWTMVSESRVSMDSDVQYLGASADGQVIVRLADGRTQIWGTGR